MDITEQLKKWNALKKRGDVELLVKATGKNKATLSRILGGKQKPGFETLLKINKFYKKRAITIKNLEDDAN
jgi:transcriptional regulator with XRE-family HTH domain